MRRVLSVCGACLWLLLLGSSLWHVRADEPSSGGAFLPLQNTVVSGQWTFNHATPFRFEGATDDAFELSFAVPDVTADTTMTLPGGGSTAFSFLISTLTTNDVNVVNSVWGASNGLVFEGATADAFELTLSPADVGADRTVTIADMGAASALLASTLTTNAADAANSLWGVSNGLVFEGATADAFELTVAPADVGADRTITLPDMGAASAALASTLTTNTVGAANSVWGVSNGLTFEGATADAGELFLTVADIATASRTLTLPDMGAAAAVLASTLTTNTVGAANSVWGVSNGLTFEGATADAGELFLTVADVATASRTMTLPDMGAASSVFASTLATNAADVVNSVWGASNGLVFEGATADAFEVTLSLNDPTVADATFTLPNAQGVSAGIMVTAGCSFTEDATSTTHTCTIELPAGSVLVDIMVLSTVLWTDADANIVVGDDDSANGYFTATQLDTTDLVVGERLQAASDNFWGGVNGAYLTTAGRIGPAAATDAGGYRTVAAEVIGVVSVATPTATAGRSFMFVTYVTPTLTAATTA